MTRLSLITISVWSVTLLGLMEVTLELTNSSKNVRIDANCYYSINDSQVFCKSSRSRKPSAACVTVEAGGKGPAPVGRSRIGPEFIHHNVYWHNLYPESVTTSGNRSLRLRDRLFYDYYRVNPDTGRSYIAFHVGNRSLGCVTVSNSCYVDNLRPQLSLGTPTVITVQALTWTTHTVYNRSVVTIGWMYVGETWGDVGLYSSGHRSSLVASFLVFTLGLLAY